MRTSVFNIKFAETECNPLEIRNSSGETILIVRQDGSIRWKNKEVETNDELREAAILMMNSLTVAREQNGY